MRTIKQLSLKNLKFKNFRMDRKTEEESFSKLITELEGVSCLAHDVDQSSHVL